MHDSTTNRADRKGPKSKSKSRIAPLALAGVVVGGSWARGEAASGSDVDVLVVVDREVPVVRSLYRRWDEEPVWWEGRRVEPHFVHLPPPGDVDLEPGAR